MTTGSGSTHRRRGYRIAGVLGLTMLFVQCTPPTPAPPAATQFVERFESQSSVNRFTRAVYHRNLMIGAEKQHDFDESWSGDHNHACEGPTTQRVVRPSADGRDPEAFWWCAPGNEPAKGHFMTSMGDIDGYSIVSFSPNQVMQNFRSVCWSVNLTDLLRRKWWEVIVVPESAFQANGRSLAYTHFGQDWAHELPAGSIMMMHFNGEAGLFVGGEEVEEWRDDFETNDKARRYRHCLTDNLNGTITATQERDTGTETWTFAGSFPARARVLFTDQSYTPTKDGTPQGFTWHWDDIEVR